MPCNKIRWMRPLDALDCLKVDICIRQLLAIKSVLIGNKTEDLKALACPAIEC